jgi:hypothetical protein
MVITLETANLVFDGVYQKLGRSKRQLDLRPFQ